MSAREIAARNLVLFAACASVAAVVGAQQPGAAPRSAEPTVAVQSSGVPGLIERLSALDPSAPMDYFDLAEEVAFEIPGEPGRRLARTLFVLAYESAARNGEGEALATSVCIALAELSTDDQQKRWLRTLAATTATGASVGHGTQHPGLTPAAASTRLALAAALGEFRAGKYRRAHDILKRGEVRDLLTQSAGSLDHADRILASVSRSVSCPECRGDRYVRRPNEGTGYAICPTCGGNPGPILSADQFLQELRLESALLEGQQRTWGAQVLVDGGSPLVEPDPAELAPAFGVDPLRCFWRPGDDSTNAFAGRWLTREEAVASDRP